MPFTFTVTRSNTSQIANPLTINLTVGGTATFPIDYTVTGADTFTATTATLTIPANQTSASIIATPTADTNVEADETIILTILPTHNVSGLGTSPSATATIINDDLNDPLFANVVLLIKPIGADNSTTFVDSSTSAKSITTVGNTKIIDNQAVFDGSGDYLITPSSSDFNMGNGDFTIESLFETTQNLAFATLLSRATAGFGAGAWAILFNAGKVHVYWADYSSSAAILAATNASNNGSSTHVAWERFGNNHTLYINGISVSTASSSAVMTDTSAPLTFGTDLIFSPRDFEGKSQVFRITKGVARYQGNFTPPAIYPAN